LREAMLFYLNDASSQQCLSCILGAVRADRRERGSLIGCASQQSLSDGSFKELRLMVALYGAKGLSARDNQVRTAAHD
jgi:hypothetical protein